VSCSPSNVSSMQGERGCTVETWAELLGQHRQCSMIQMGGELTAEPKACSSCCADHHQSSLAVSHTPPHQPLLQHPHLNNRDVDCTKGPRGMHVLTSE